MLTDKFSRKLDYLRVSITDKCNLRCKYCMPAEGVEILSHDEVLRNEEFIHFIGLFVNLGIKKIRFTGGEPLLRKGFLDILKDSRRLFPDLEIGITTNGVLLGDVLDDLFRLKIDKLNISLDTVSREEYKRITGRDFFDRVINSIDKALSYNFFDIKINSVLFDNTLVYLDDFLDYFKERGVTLRFIERMPFRESDRAGEPVLYDVLIEALKNRGELIRCSDIDTLVAYMYSLLYRDKHRMKIGIIPAMTHNICSRCNRLRLTCDGFLRTCLHSNYEYDLKTPYRMDMGDDALRDIILRAVSEKPEKHNLNCQRHSDDGCSSVFSKRGMYRIGG